MTIYFSDYNIHNNPALALSEMLSDVNDGDTVIFNGSVISITPEYAISQDYYLPRYSKRPKNYAFYLENKKNITIEGNDSTFLFDGNVSAFGFRNCENIVLKNFKIDYKTLNFIQGKIIEACDEYFTVDFSSDFYKLKYDCLNRSFSWCGIDSNYSFTDSSFLCYEFDFDEKRPYKNAKAFFVCLNEPHPVYTAGSVCVDTTQISDTVFRFFFKGRAIPFKVGNYLVSSVHERRNNNMHFLDCKNIVLENIDMYSSLSFGVIALLCENITIRNVNSLLRPDSNRLLAVIADMFHFVNTRGKVDISDCRIENLMDDCINVHSLLSVPKEILNDHTMLVHFTYLAKRAINLYHDDEIVSILDGSSFERLASYTVKSSEFIDDYHLRVEFYDNISDISLNSIIESEDAKPELYIRNCCGGNNRGRGFLVPAGRKTVVENCRLYSSSTGVSVCGASKDYLEGSAVTDLTITGNDFTDCAYLGNSPFAIHIVPEGISCNGSRYHSNIRIVGNKFSSEHTNFVKIKNSSEISVKDNILVDKNKNMCRALTDGILLEFCSEYCIL